jgi:serine/threonine protein kinase
MSEVTKHEPGASTSVTLEASAPFPSPPGFLLFDQIGQGGMGVVYRARDEGLGRDVAFKFLSKRYSADSPAAQRFAHEASETLVDWRFR